MKNPCKLLSAVIVPLLVVGCAAPVHERVVIKEPPPRVIIRHMPAPIHEVPPPVVGSDYAWVPGHWVWRHTGWEWQAGQWHHGHVRPMPPIVVEQITVAPSPAHYWIPGHWRWHRDDWEWVRGHWAS